MSYSRVKGILYPITLLRSGIYLILLSVSISSSSAAPFPQDMDFSRFTGILLDRGELWQSNSIAHPLNSTLQDSAARHAFLRRNTGWLHSYLDSYSRAASRIHESSADGLSILALPGIGSSVQCGPERSYLRLAVQPFLWSEAVFRHNWYARLYVRSTNESASLPHYSGEPRSISRAGMNTGEIDQSVLGYQNEWIRVEYGRSRDIWGPMTEDNLVLAGNAPSWERLMIQTDYRRFSYRWFYGFLESIPGEENIQRYIVGRALEYRNRKNLVLGLGEVSILAGPDRPLDLAYLNPLAVHLEIEQNDRTNFEGNRENAMWFFHFDWLLKPALRLSGSFLLDEIQLDKVARDEGRADALGWLGRIAWSPDVDNIDLSFYTSYTRINTYTMQHLDGNLNFVTRNQLLGHPIGNDADLINIGMIAISRFNTLIEMELGRIRWGDNSLVDDPYRPFLTFWKEPFPSGEVKTNDYLAIRLLTQPVQGFSCNIDGHIDLHRSGNGSALEAWTFTIRYQVPFLMAGI